MLNFSEINLNHFIWPSLDPTIMMEFFCFKICKFKGPNTVENTFFGKILS